VHSGVRVREIAPPAMLACHCIAYNRCRSACRVSGKMEDVSKVYLFIVLILLGDAICQVTGASNSNSGKDR